MGSAIEFIDWMKSLKDFERDAVLHCMGAFNCRYCIYEQDYSGCLKYVTSCDPLLAGIIPNPNYNTSFKGLYVAKDKEGE